MSFIEMSVLLFRLVLIHTLTVVVAVNVPLHSFCYFFFSNMQPFQFLSVKLMNFRSADIFNTTKKKAAVIFRVVPD